MVDIDAARRFLAAEFKSAGLPHVAGGILVGARWAVVDGDRMRMLTVDEGRAAMGFPSTYQLPSNKRDAMQMLGNAVCPPKARAIITALREAA